jgi:hypothetical protein
MRTHFFSAAALCSIVAAPVAAQNLVVNGDFESGTLAPWTFHPDLHAETAMVASIETFQGSKMFRLNPGTMTSAPGGGNLEQEVQLVGGATYTVSGNLYIENVRTGNNAQGGVIEVTLGNLPIFTVDQGSIEALTTLPFPFETNFEAPFSGDYAFRLRFTRVWRNFTPSVLHWVDNLAIVSHTLPCYANCDTSTTEPILNVEDFICFVSEFANGLAVPPAQQIAHYANCDGSTTEPVLNVEDFICFVSAFAQGCP